MSLYGWLALAAALTGCAVLAMLLASPTRRADLDRRRATMRALHRLEALTRECSRRPDPALVPMSVAAAIEEVLDLDGCWYESPAATHDLPELGPDGEVGLLVQPRRPGGAVLPPLLALPVAGAHGSVGRFVLEAKPTVGLSIERRVVAVAMAQLVSLSRPAPQQHSGRSSARASEVRAPEEAEHDLAVSGLHLRCGHLRIARC